MQINLVEAINTTTCGRIPKIKALRCAAGLGLKEAKDIIDALIDNGTNYMFHFNSDDASKTAAMLRYFNDVGVLVTIIDNAALAKQKKTDAINNLLDNFTSDEIINEMLNNFTTYTILKQMIKKCVDDGMYGYASALLKALDSPPFTN